MGQNAWAGEGWQSIPAQTQLQPELKACQSVQKNEFCESLTQIHLEQKCQHRANFKGESHFIFLVSVEARRIHKPPCLHAPLSSLRGKCTI